MVPLILLAAVATAPLRVDFDAAVFGPCSGSVVAEALDTKPPSIVRRPLDPANAALLPLDPHANWRITLVEGRCWAAPIRVPAGGSREVITVQAWPRRQLKGKLTASSGESVPSALEVTLQSPPAADGVIPLRERVVQECAVDGSEWRCAVPATLLDARLEAPGFAPVYLWSRDLRANDLDAGTVKLERGASVVGWVTGPDGGSASGAEVVLRPAATAETGAVTRHLDAQATNGKTSVRGFFQIAAIPNGTYSLTVRAEGMSPERVEDLRITEAREYAFQELRLTPLGRLTVSITPAVSGKGGPWRVKLRPQAPAAAPPENFELRAANPDGEWRQGGLERGLYRLSVYNEAGARVAEREVDVRGGSETVQITVREIPVEGRVHAGARSLPGKLRFEGDGAKVEMETDSSGEFAGSLPNEGSWRVQITPGDARQRLRVQNVMVRLQEGEAAAHVDIDLPGGVLEGRVVDPAGNGVRDAEVIVRRGTVLETNGSTDDDGHFHLFGMREEQVAVVATRGSLDTDEVKTVVTGNTAPILLQLRELRNIPGRLVRMDGSPVTGAIIRYFYGTRVPDPAISGPAGNFVLKVPTSLPSLTVVVIATGLPVKLQRILLPADDGALEIGMSGVGGELVIRGEGSQLPLIIREAARSSLRWMFAPQSYGPPAEWKSDGFHLRVEAGNYALCAGSRCIDALVTPGGTAYADFRNRSGAD